MTSRSNGSRKISLLLAAAILLVAGTAFARKRIVLTKFDGKGDSAQTAVAAALARDSTVIGDATWTRAQRRLKLKSAASPQSMARISADLQADGVILGSVRKTGAAWGLTLTVVDGKTGQVSDTLSIPLRSYRMDRDSKKAIAAQLAPAVAKLGTEPAVEINPEPLPSPTGPRASADVDTEKPPLTEPPPPVDTHETTAEPTTTVASSAAGRYSRDSAADIDVGLGFLVRSLSFNYSSSLTGSQIPNGYSGSLVPSVVVNGELYPFALGGKSGPLGSIGLAFTVERVLTIKSKLNDTEYDTSQTRFGGGLRYRINFGDKETSPTLKILAGINHLDFTIDRGSANLGFPNVSYTYIDLGAAGRIPLGSPQLALYASLRYLAVLSTGEITTADFYGTGGATGFDGELGIEYIFARRGIIRAGGHYQRFGFDFDGNGALSNNRDGNSATQEVGGATDQFYGGMVTAGYLF